MKELSLSLGNLSFYELPEKFKDLEEGDLFTLEDVIIEFRGEEDLCSIPHLFLSEYKSKVHSLVGGPFGEILKKEFEIMEINKKPYLVGHNYICGEEVDEENTDYPKYKTLLERAGFDVN